MKTLYIIGNGFGIHHTLDTKYQSSGKYLVENNNDMYNLLLTYYALPDIANTNLSNEKGGHGQDLNKH